MPGLMELGTLESRSGGEADLRLAAKHLTAALQAHRGL